MKMRVGGLQVRPFRILIFVVMLSPLLAVNLRAQDRNATQGGGTGRAIAPKDLTGYWVSVVNENWRWRMTVPDKSDYVNVPLTAEGRKVADTWEPGKDQAAADQCKPYGAAALMNVPGRLHISWQDDNTLRIDTDSGTQTRLLHFGGSAPESKAADWQGYSIASWGDENQPIDQRIGGGGPEGQGGPEYENQVPIGAGGPSEQAPAAAPARKKLRETYLKVTTTRMRPGYLRRNGIPYGTNAKLEEFYTTYTDPFRNDTWLMVTIVVTDPQYLIEPYISHAHFKKIADGSGWDPTPCRADQPR